MSTLPNGMAHTGITLASESSAMGYFLHKCVDFFLNLAETCLILRKSDTSVKIPYSDCGISELFKVPEISLTPKIVPFDPNFPFSPPYLSSWPFYFH